MSNSPNQTLTEPPFMPNPVGRGTVVAPEFTLSSAMAQWKEVADILQYWEDSWGKSKEAKWLDRSGAFFVVMGGYFLEWPDMEPPGDNPPGDKPPGDEPPGDKPPGDNPPKTLKTPAVSASGFKQLLHHKIIQRLVKDGKLRQRDFNSCGINNKSKASIVAKMIVFGQLIWMLIQCVGRKIDGLPVTLLEIHILIQVAYTLLAYICWWDKPLDVAEAITIPLERSDVELLKPENFFADLEDGSRHDRNSLRVRNRAVYGGPLSPSSRASYDLVWTLDHETRGWVTIMGVVNGALHCVAWVAHFPTPIEMWLWRASSLMIAVLHLIFYLAMLGHGGPKNELYILKIAQRVAHIDNCSLLRGLRECYEEALHGQEKAKWVQSYAKAALWLALLIAYLFCILFVTIESFISVRSLPAGAYATVRWSNYFPRI
ncbi:hypothetical protein DL768_007970 [Monosporascus sp. mg162]|nr:hypothetical protein DL768_007970 [Monosporascus sp. mg162]